MNKRKLHRVIASIIAVIFLCSPVIIQAQMKSTSVSDEQKTQLMKELAASIGEERKEVEKPSEERLGLSETKNRARLLRSETINHVVGRTIFYESWFTNYFTAGDRVAYCLQPAVVTPPTGAYGISRYVPNNSRYAKGLYYLYGGPGYQIWYQSFGAIGASGAGYNEDSEYTMTHVMLSYIYDPSGSAFVGLSQDLINALIHQVGLLDQLPDAPWTFKAFIYNEGGGAGQVMGGSSYTPNGKVKIKKVSANPEITEGNGCYTFEGAEFTLFKAGTNEVVGTLIADAAGNTGELEVLEGDYQIQETKSPKGYLAKADRVSVTVTREKTVTVEIENVPGSDPIGVLLGKIDAETNKNKPQGTAKLIDGEFTVKYYDVLLDEAEKDVDPATKGYEPKRTWVFKTNENGFANLHGAYQIGGDNLYLSNGMPTVPFGTLTVQETKAPLGYLLKDKSGKVPGVHVRRIIPDEQGRPVYEYNVPLQGDQVIRGDLKGLKVSDGEQKRLACVPFRITSVTTKESHVVVTDKNGEFNTSSAWNPHSNYTNRGEEPTDGIWFGELTTLDDKKGALIYDTYLVEELPCEANEDKVLIEPFEITISRDLTTIELGTITNDIKATITIGTKARDKKTGTQEAIAEKEMIFEDEVRYEGLNPELEYELRGILMDKETEKPLLINGEEVRATKTFRSKFSDGAEVMTFTFDGSELGGKDIVVFEELYLDGELIASHADIEDKGQTIKIKEQEQPEVPEKPANPPQEVVQTGDASNIILLVLFAIISAIAVIVILKKKKK
ncbi:LPXTG-motif cell wall-anchored protein [Lachnospiraceae bacterium PF1-21]|uniref:VaFE repeat-containing surface-anchored protein n=1 Tax=Ohessyouella blattaphilus TaxID=2949333 RepID=A0ABT1EKT7_9FIRM|nr:VaFE repeat-containing surface-anchored protein [Ohessyouella blattaphilus]MCP1111094.1 VaFE repeat-containing surface-anchored protein [Ohessyouella blattaphilus]MCR8564488.1 VaFE repeat-containing surface-anchored protein [Ohessyouella blattaphilus]